MDTIESYDYLKDSTMSEEDIKIMIELNPYRRYHSRLFGFGKHIELREHRHFNQVYALGYIRGVTSKLLEVGALLKEKGMPKEEIRQLFNKVLQRELLKPI